MSGLDYVPSAPRAVSVLPSHARRQLTRRDGLLPLVLALELLAGVVFGLAAHAGSSTATSVPARLTLGSAVLPSSSLRPMASVVAAGPRVLPSVGPVAPAAALPTGPAVGPLVPGTVRAPMPVATLGVPAAARPAAPVRIASPSPTPYATHAPRDPFAALVTTP